MATDYNNRANNIEREMQKLEHQLKLLQELERLTKTHAGSQAGLVAIQSEINAKYKVQNDLLKAGIDISKNSFNLEQKINDVIEKEIMLGEKLIDVNRKRELQQKEELLREEELNRKRREAEKQAAEARKKELQDEAEKYKNETESAKMKEKISQLEVTILDASKEQTAEARKKQLADNEELKKLNEKLKLLEKQERIESKSKESKQSSINSIKVPGLGTVGELKAFSELNTSAKLFSVGAEVFNEAVGTFTKYFSQGINDISSKANTQYQNISTRTGMNYSTYRNSISGMRNTLSSWGGADLSDNIRTTDVQDMMNSLAKTGMGDEQLMANAIDSVITSSIVPYLELTSSEMQRFNQVTGGEMMKQIRGISKVNQDLFGSNEVATKYLQDQLNYLEPISAVAELDLIQNSTEMMGYYQQLRAQGMSDSQIAKEIATVRRIGDDPSGMLQNGTDVERLAVIRGINQNRNFAEDPYGIATDVGDVNQFMANMGPSDGGITTSLYANAVGIIGGFRGQYEVARGKFDRGAAMSGAKQAGAYLQEAGITSWRDFTNGANQTPQQKQTTYLENLATEVAMIKVDSGIWFDTLTTAVKGIATILVTYFAGKAVSGIGSSLLKGTGGVGKGSLFTKGINAVGSGLMDVGFAAGYGGNSIAGAIGTGLATTAGAAAVIGGGAALGVNGTKSAINDIQNGEVNAGTGLSAIQGAAGLTAAGAGLVAGGSAIAGGAGLAGGIAAAATNPVGWVALAVAGIALVGKAAYDSANAYKQSGKLVEQEFNKVQANLDRELTERENYLESIKEDIRTNEDLESARQELINSGLLSEEDLQKAQSASREELEKLTEQYIKSTRDFSDTANDLLDKYKDVGRDEANNATKQIRDWYNENKNTKNDTNAEIMKQMVYSTVSALEAKQANGGSLTEDEQWFLTEYDKNISKGKTSQQDWEWLLDKGNNLSVLYGSVRGQDLEDLTRNMIKSGAGGISQYSYLDPNKIATYLVDVVNATSKEEAEKALAAAKAAGLKKDDFSEIGDAMTTWGITSYRVGTDYIPYDNYPALLHEGEAVLTASTANELRNLIDEYRTTREDNIKITQAIQEQTSILVARLDAIYTKMPSSAEAEAQEIMPGKLNQNARNMTTAFNQF